MKVNDVLACSFPSWYDKFKKCTIKSIVLPLTSEVLTYMQDNGTLVLPEGSQPEVTYNEAEHDSDVDDWDHCEASSQTVEGPKLAEYDAKMKEAIRRLGGSVFPKLNWSSPKDASWMALNNSLRCYTPGDVYLLLKSSNFVTHDLTTPFKDCDDSEDTDANVDYCIVLRKWMEINPTNEFRCFVRNKELVGMCQRDISQSYSCIGADKTNICTDIISFWRENIENRFPLNDYVFDVCRPEKDHVILLDFNPFGEVTDGLLFTWPELKELKASRTSFNRIIEEETWHDDVNIENERDIVIINERNIDSNRQQRSSPDALLDYGDTRSDPEFRYITDETGVQPGPYMQYGLPVDILDLSTGQDPLKLIDFLQMKIQSEADESSEEEEEDVTS